MGFTANAALKRVDSAHGSVPYFTLSSSGPAQRLSIEKTGALFSNAYLAAEQAKARALGGLPCRVYTQGDRGGREPARDHPLTSVCARRWNPVMTAQTGWQWLSVRRDTFGTAYVRVQWERGAPVAFWPIETSVEVSYDHGATVSPVRYRISAGDRFTSAGVYLEHEILAFPTCISTDGGVTGRSLAELGAAEIGLDIDLTRFYANIIAKGFSPAGWLEHPGVLKNDEVASIAEKNRILSGADRAGEVRIFDRGLKYHPVGQSMAEADIIKQEEYILQSVARAVYVQPNKVFDFSRATYSNIEEASIAFVTDTMTNEVTALEAEVGKLLMFMGEVDNYLKFDLRGLQRGNFKEQMDGFRVGVYAGFYSRAEIREWLELPFIEGTDELLQPTAYYTINPETGEPRPLPEGAVSRRTPAENLLAPVIEDARARIADRCGKDGDTPKTREFARTVLTPVARAFDAAGEEFDIDSEIEEAINA